MATPVRESGRWAGRPGRLGVAGLLAAGTLLLYAQVVRHGFLLYDDWTYVTDPHVRAGLSVGNVLWAFTTLTFSNWHPLTWLSYMLDVQLFGLDAGAMHLVNAALHAANAGLLFLVLDGMTRARGRSLAVAALFAVHPLHVESVAWIAERKDVLSTLFGLAALWAYRRHVDRPGPGRYAAVLVAFGASLLAKPMLVTLPFLLLLLDFWPLRRVAALRAGDADAPAGGPRSSATRLVAEKLPLLALSVVSSAITILAQDRGGALQGLELPLGARIANALVSYMRYVGMIVWPTRLAIFYPHPKDLPALEVLGAAIAIAGTTAVALLRARRWPWFAVGWCWFLGSLVPVIGVVQVGGQALADRYTYLPSVGLFLVAAWSAHALVERSKPRWLGGAIACATVTALSVLSWRQIGVWRDHETVFEHAIAVTGENPRAHAALAAGLRSAGRLDEALAHAKEALRLEPGSARSWTTLGMVEADLGQWSAARDALETAARIDARLPLAWRFLGQAAAALGRPEEAEQALRRATELAPGDAGAWNELGLVLASRRRGVEALEAYRRALVADPAAVAAWLNLATLCDALGRTAEATSAFEEAVRADPASPDAWRARGRFLRDHGSPSGAAESFQEADRLEAASRRAPRNGVVPRGRRRVRRRTAGRSPPRAAGAELGLYSRPSRGERESR